MNARSGSKRNAREERRQSAMLKKDMGLIEMSKMDSLKTAFFCDGGISSCDSDIVVFCRLY